ncbi:heavy metal translocating P-type ATPase, partial [Myxococcota bacterium]|nr:heavy metal translocating P-type ATPase [Myxococcota bacterium]
MHRATSAAEDLATTSDVDVCELPIAGMTCASCVRRVEKALHGVDGVTDATVNLVTARATIRYDARTTSTAALARAIEAAGYEVPRATRRTTEKPDAKARAAAQRAAEDDEQRALVRDLKVAIVLTVPLLVLAMSHGAIIPATDGPIGRWAQLLLATPVVFGPGRRFLALAWRAARHRTADMNTLVSLGVLSGFAYSTAAVVAPSLFPHAEHGMAPHVYFEAAAAIITFVLLGKWLEPRSRRRLSDAVRGLVALQPATATRVDEARPTETESVAVEALSAGDRLLIRPGERVPTDAVVERGTSAIDESMLTGESMPVDKTPGDPIFGGTLNQMGALIARVTKTGSDTALARIVDAVEQAQGSRAPIARLADVVSGYFVPVVIGIALATFAIGCALDPSASGVATAVERFVAVLVIACPCALGLATPAAVAVGTGRGAELGVLIKGGAALEAASRIDEVIFDKTGTLTSGKPSLTDVVALDDRDAHALLSLVASVEAESEHPIGRAITRDASSRGATPSPVEGFSMSPGGGVSGRVGGARVVVGTAEHLGAAGVDATPLEARAEALAAAGKTPIFVAVDGALAGLVAVADRATPEAKRVVAELKAMSIDVVMSTGDRARTARAVADELGITRVIAEVKPEEKARVVRAARDRGRRVAMVGDGINDAPALAAAHVGIAVANASDI